MSGSRPKPPSRSASRLSRPNWTARPPKAEATRLEEERLAGAEAAEQERIAAEQAELDRQAAEAARLEQERLAAEQAELDRRATEAEPSPPRA